MPGASGADEPSSPDPFSLAEEETVIGRGRQRKCAATPSRDGLSARTCKSASLPVRVRVGERGDERSLKVAASSLLATSLRLESGVVDWENPEIDRLVDAGAAETDPAKRKAIYSQVQKIVAEEVPSPFVMFWDTVLVFSQRLKGMPERAANPDWLYQEIHRFWLAEE